MSIDNRKLKEGKLSVNFESKFQTMLGKAYCLLTGHKEVKIKTDTFDKNYCICCWKELS
jgi:hypothetical protein